MISLLLKDQSLDRRIRLWMYSWTYEVFMHSTFFFMMFARIFGLSSTCFCFRVALKLLGFTFSLLFYYTFVSCFVLFEPFFGLAFGWVCSAYEVLGDSGL